MNLNHSGPFLIDFAGSCKARVSLISSMRSFIILDRQTLPTYQSIHTILILLMNLECTSDKITSAQIFRSYS